jgi:preprotein translocase subunit SecF
MEFFHEPNIDWMGIKWYLIILSLSLAAAGLISIAVHRGLTYGIDFRSGTQVTVRFAKQPNLDSIRHQLDQEGIHDAVIQQIGLPSDNEVIIGMGLSASGGEDALDAGRDATIKALNGLFGQGAADKVDFNNASPQTIAEHLVVADPLGLASKGTDEATRAYNDLGNALVNFRNTPPRGGLIAGFDELRSVPGVTPGVISALEKDFNLSSFAIRSTQTVGPKVSSDLRRQALYVTLAGLGAMLVYIWFRFELIYGVAAVIATFHDVIITIGFFSLLDKAISLTVIAALLTLVGYSMNDTIVVFDRIRENVRLSKRENFLDLVNRSINQTLSRTILTSGLTFVAVLSLFIFGGEVIHGFAFTLVIGVLIGTYSSIAIASPVLVFWQNRALNGSSAAKPKPLQRGAAGPQR